MENKLIRQRLDTLRKAMKAAGADYYIITSADCHGSEYVHEHFRTRAYFSGFSGSAGTLLVSEKEAALWTDGRYFLQAEEELSGTGITLMRMQEKDVPTLEAYLEERVEAGETIGFDGACVSAALGEKLEKLAAEKGGKLCFEKDIADMAWPERPEMPAGSVWELKEDYAGESCIEKLKKVRDIMKEGGADFLFLNSLDDIMWLFNLRGSDVACNPVALSYAMVGMEECTLFLQKKAAGELSLKQYGVEIEEYGELYPWLDDFLKKEGRTGAQRKDISILVSKEYVNYRLLKTLSAGAELLFGENPTTILKAVKNETELSRSRQAYLADSAAVCKFIYWLKKEIGKQELTELSVADMLEKFRREIPEFLDLSFPTICGYLENAALPHYQATKQAYKKLEAKGMVLIDSGGQYMGGTTDITRTIVLGEVSEEEKKAFSLVAAAMLRLSDAVFLEGTTGKNLDILARQELWKEGLDYKHGTGHGIGYVLNVHEGPQRINWHFGKGAKDYPLQAGMLISDEPGLYLEGRFGVRTENIIEVVEKTENEYGRFLGFHHLTYVPIDREALDKKYLTQEDVKRIDQYHKEVYEKVAPYLNEEEKVWLSEVTREL